jgi:hypothetical protein
VVDCSSHISDISEGWAEIFGISLISDILNFTTEERVIEVIFEPCRCLSLEEILYEDYLELEDMLSEETLETTTED